MSEKKKIPCRVCGKLFEPCSYCQSHADVFRWRNFACSIECATKYTNDTIAYRESIKNKKTLDKNEKIVSKIATENETKSEDVVTTTTATKKKSTKKNSTIVIENNETE